jgi:hypothetical protein
MSFDNVHSDSLTTVLNDAVEKYTLNVSDVRSLLANESINIYIPCGNIGDHIHGIKAGTILKTKDYLDEFHSATFTQSFDNGMTGSLYMHDVNLTYENWTWEVNAFKYCRHYWTRLSDLASKGIYENNLPDNTKVGWCGPALLANDIDNLPDTFVHYDTYIDDYFVIRNKDLTDFYTINLLTMGG